MPDYTWGQWVYSTNTITSSTANTWDAWNVHGSISTTNSLTVTTGTSATWSSWNGALAYQQPTAEDLARGRLREEARQAQYAAERERQREAKEKATRLLISCLNRLQRETYEKQRYFDVRAIRPDGQETTYRIRQGQSGNVDELDADGKGVRRFCIHPSGVPDEDAMLAQKLLLETDVATFERVANITPLRRTA